MQNWSWLWSMHVCTLIRNPENSTTFKVSIPKSVGIGGWCCSIGVPVNSFTKNNVGQHQLEQWTTFSQFEDKRLESSADLTLPTKWTCFERWPASILQLQHVPTNNELRTELTLVNNTPVTHKFWKSIHTEKKKKNLICKPHWHPFTSLRNGANKAHRFEWSLISIVVDSVHVTDIHLAINALLKLWQIIST